MKSTQRIHPSALVDSSARIADNVVIGPYAVIGPEVEIGPDCEIGAHAVLEGPTTIGRGNRIFQFASVGSAPQDLKYAGEPTRLEIGDGNTIREFVTINRGTTKEAGVTRIGSHCLFMAYAHVAHDCIIGDHVVMANAATLAGHVVVEDHAILGGLCAVHQFARVGAHAILGGGTMAPQDIPPFVMAAGNHAELHGVNVRGLERRGFSAEDIRQLKRAYKLLFRGNRRLDTAIEEVRAQGLQSPHVQYLIDFMKQSKRGVTR